jgi:hypothetical protein
VSASLGLLCLGHIFTYNGGLLRHEREVHKMHGGAKKSLFCPFSDCRRSVGSGFTRKENLDEHSRRVHRTTGTSCDPEHRGIAHSDTQHEATEVRPTSTSSFQPTLDLGDRESETVKRRRVSDAGIAEEADAADLRAEIKRLRKGYEDMEARLRKLE